MKKTFVQILALVLAVTLCLAGLTACSGSSSNGGAYREEGYYPAATYAVTTAAAAMVKPGYAADASMGYAAEEDYYYESPSPAETGSAGSGLFEPGDSRKLIRNASMSIETEQYEDSVAAMRDQIKACQGYIENSSSGGNAKSGGRWLDVTVRVPADRLEEFMAASEGFGVVQSTNIWQEDVTMSYTDMETRLATLNTKKERLLEMLEKATKMADIIELENALQETIYEIESYTSSLNRLDDRIAYSSVSINLREVYKAATVPTMPKSLGERISQEFRESMENLREFGEDFLVWLVGALPVIVILAILAVVIILICRGAAKRSRRRRAERAGMINGSPASAQMQPVPPGARMQAAPVQAPPVQAAPVQAAPKIGDAQAPADKDAPKQ